MKVNRALETHWQKQHTFELKLEKEAERKRLHHKQDVKHEIELQLYERHVKKLRLDELNAKGKNVDMIM